MAYYLKHHKKLCAAYFLLIPLSCLASIEFALSFQPIIDAALQAEEGAFVQAAAACGFWGIADIFLVLIVSRTKFGLLAKAKASLKQDLCRAVLSFSYQNFEGKDFLSLLNNDTQTIADCYFASKLALYKVVWSFALSFITVSLLSPVITGILLALGMVSVVIPRLLGKTLDSEQAKLSGRRENYLSVIKDMMDGFLTLKTGCAEGFFEKKHACANTELERQQCSVECKMYLAGWFSMMCSSIMYIATIIAGGYLVIKGHMTAGFIISISQLIGGVVAPLEQIPSMLAQMRSVRSICEKCETVLAKKTAGIIEHSEDGSLSCESVSFAYSETERGIEKLDYVFHPNKKYLITGTSGSGKSTLAKLLAGLYDCSDGKICYPARMKSFEQMMYLPQKVHIFNDTLRNNITLGRTYNDSDIFRALEQCGLNNLVSSLPRGLDEVIGETRPCSGGEAQRIGIVRALLRKPEILILDEVTASLDKENALKVEALLLSIPDTMIISISHHMADEMAEQYDDKIIIDAGRIK